jgi:hypothetical protein
MSEAEKAPWREESSRQVLKYRQEMAEYHQSTQVVPGATDHGGGMDEVDLSDCLGGAGLVHSIQIPHHPHTTHASHALPPALPSSLTTHATQPMEPLPPAMSSSLQAHPHAQFSLPPAMPSSLVSSYNFSIHPGLASYHHLSN